MKNLTFLLETVLFVFHVPCLHDFESKRFESCLMFFVTRRFRPSLVGSLRVGERDLMVEFMSDNVGN